MQDIVEVSIRLTGTTELLMHNDVLADPTHPITKSIKAITDKKKNMTEEDQIEKERLEHLGGLYLDQAGHVVIPTRNVQKCLIDAATVRRLGTAVARGLIMTSSEEPLDYTGPRTVEGLWADRNYRSRMLVGVNRNRVTRVRPKFMPWAVTVPGLVMTDVLNLSDLIEIARMAGLMQGLGDGRRIGKGRFNAEVTISEAVKVA